MLAWEWLALMFGVSGAHGSRRLIDTHVHNADLTAGISYGFPSMFPDLNRSWSMSDFSRETAPCRARGASIEAILMTLEKAENSREQIFAEAALYDRTARASANETTIVIGFVGGVMLEAGPADTVALQEAYPTSLLGVRQGLWHQPPAFFRNRTVVKTLEAIGDLRLPFDVLVHASQLQDLYALASAVDLLHPAKMDLLMPCMTSPWTDPRLRTLGAMWTVSV